MTKRHARFVRLLDTMTRMGENNMGDLTCEQAKTFHAATDTVRAIVRAFDIARDDDPLEDFNYVGSRHHY